MNNSKKFKILIAEDAHVQGKKLQYVLEKFGYEVHWALDGLKALELLETQDFSLIISDYQMPQLDGLEFLKKVRNSREFSTIPFILLTTIEDEMVFLESLEAGANEFLNKPFRPEELKLRVKNLISLYHYQMILDEDNKELNLKILEQNSLLKKHLEELNSAHEELKNMQETLIINSKMASLGVMSAGVAHEINNPLTIIKMYNKKLKNILDQDKIDRDRLLELNKNIDINTERIKNIVMHLKEFSRTENTISKESELINLKELFKGIKDFYITLVEKYKIKIIENIDGSVEVKMNRTCMEQIFINLIQNAVDAVENQENKIIEIKAYREENDIFIEIIDSGCGIPEENQIKIFDPFFTTKDVGRGTGLGLSLVNSYLKSNNGSIVLHSVPGKTCFKIILKDQINESKKINVA